MLIDFEDRTEEGQEMLLAYLDGRKWKPARRRFSGDAVLAVLAGVQLAAMAILSIAAHV
jgi:hypothetical protein